MYALWKVSEGRGSQNDHSREERGRGCSWMDMRGIFWPLPRACLIVQAGPGGGVS